MSNLLKNIINTAIDYLSPQNSPTTTTVEIPGPQLSRQNSLKDRLDAACHSPTTSIAHLDPILMRRELDAAKHDLARSKSDALRLEERCKMLEKSLKDTRDLLRSREAELDRLRRDRDREKAMAERRRSDTGPLYTSSSPPQHVHPRYSSSLDTRITAADIARGMSMRHSNGYLHEDDARSVQSVTTDPSTTSSSSDIYGHYHPSQLTISSNQAVQAQSGEDKARLRSSETFLTRTDSWSGAQILQAVHDINSEILQFAASATETCTFSSPSSSRHPSSAYSQSIQDTTARIGPHMTKILATRDHSQDPLLVQLALQGCLSLCVARAMSSFCIGFPSKSDAVLAQIYSHMHLHEPQPTSARWRALTHHHINAIYPTLQDYSISELTDTILRWAADIFLIAHSKSFSPPSPSSPHTPSSSPGTTFSISPPTSRHHPHSHSSSHQTIPTPTPQSLLSHLRQTYSDQIKRISTSILSLSKTTKEEIMSTSFEVVIADPVNAVYDTKEMGDAFGEYGDSRGKVLATLEIGVRCLTRVASPGAGVGGKEDDDEVREEGAFESRLLLLPKVVLESVLDVLDR